MSTRLANIAAAAPDTAKWGDEYWRELLQETIRTYVADDYRPDTGVTAAGVAAEAGIRTHDGPALHKTERYAAAGAAIWRITALAIEGSGADARYRREFVRLGHHSLDPFDWLNDTAGQTFYGAARQAQKDPGTLVGHFLQRFKALGRGNEHVTAGFILAGGTMPHELASYSRVAGRALHHTPATSQWGGMQRARAVHQLAPMVTRRASVHLDNVLDGPQWSQVEQMGPQVVPLGRHGQAAGANSLANPAEGAPPPIELAGPDGEKLFPVAQYIADMLAPLLRCPAHQRIFGTQSALQLQLHAGINLAAEDRGMFTPAFAAQHFAEPWPSK